MTKNNKCPECNKDMLLDKEKAQGFCIWCQYGMMTPEEEDWYLTQGTQDRTRKPQKKKKGKRKLKPKVIPAYERKS